MKEKLHSLLTESPNPRSKKLDTLPTLRMLRLMNSEDAQVLRAVKRILPALAGFVDKAAERLRKNGRLFYVGAGTSGRLGILDASECPPTFGTDPWMVQGIIAGGKEAVFRAVEKAEDDEDAGALALRKKKLGGEDCVVGLSASGRTPFVIGALKYARSVKALTAAITCNPGAAISGLCDYPLAAVVGPEIVSGSTRLKCGTAEKMILNMISTGIMVRIGKVKGNRMVDLVPKSSKLWERAKGLVMEELGVGEKKAEALLRNSSGSARRAILLGCKRK